MTDFEYIRCPGCNKVQLTFRRGENSSSLELKTPPGWIVILKTLVYETRSHHFKYHPERNPMEWQESWRHGGLAVCSMECIEKAIAPAKLLEYTLVKMSKRPSMAVIWDFLSRFTIEDFDWSELTEDGGAFRIEDDEREESI